MKIRIFIAFLLLGSHTAFAVSPIIPQDPDSCADAISAAEVKFRLPEKLLGSIALIESGRADPKTGRTRPWPWTINALGTDLVFAHKAEAVAAVRELQATGVRSIDVGCMQINLMHHPDAFASLDEAFDPSANAAYGARFLAALYRQIGGWPQASAAYHSQTPGIGQDYEKRVMALWPLATKYPDTTLAARRTPVDPEDENRYTPEFAAALRQMHAEQRHLARLNESGPVLADLSRDTPEFAAMRRQTQADLARIAPRERLAATASGRQDRRIRMADRS